MPVGKKKLTTPETSVAIPTPVPPPSSPPPDFQHYLREQAHQVIRSFLEGVMPSSEWVGVNTAPNARAIATVIILVT